MQAGKFIRRFFLPTPLLTLIYMLKFKAKVSPRAEVELSPYLILGQGCQISSFCKIKAADGPLKIGSNVHIGSNCFISSGKAGVDIGNDCMVGPNVTIIGNNHRYDRLDVPIRMQGWTSKGIRIGSNVWIGAGVSILDGAIIEDGVIVTPNSVVSGKVLANSIFQGNPGKVVFVRR